MQGLERYASAVAEEGRETVAYIEEHRSLGADRAVPVQACEWRWVADRVKKTCRPIDLDVVG